MGKRFISIGILVIFSFLAAPAPATTPHDGLKTTNGPVAIAKAATKEEPSTWTKKVWVTAYSSTPEETDDTPFITASMKTVGDGIIAANFLPFGTKVMIPKVFGKKVFVVEDRMHERKSNFVDIWMPSKEDAINFGITYAEIVVINEG
jgi:3D (Asp-Asp-Asp) domain-containing protein